MIAQNVAELFNLKSGVRVRVRGSRAEDMTRGFVSGPEIVFAFLRLSTVRKLGKSCALLVVLGFIQNRGPWWPPGQYGAGTCMMVASSGFA